MCAAIKFKGSRAIVGTDIALSIGIFYFGPF